MTDFAMRDPDERVFCLSGLELGAAIFNGPDKDGWAAIIDAGLPELLARSFQSVAHLTAVLEKLQHSLPRQSVLPRGLDELETEYVRLFIAGAGGVVAPLYASCHQGDAPQVMGKSAQSMQSRLIEAGLAVDTDSNEPPDHLSIELEYLYNRLGRAWLDDDSTLESEARAFARGEMLPWVRRFRDTLAGGTPHPAYLHSADFVVALLGAIGG